MRGRDELEEDEFDFDEYDLPRNTYGEEEQQDGYDPADVLFVICVLVFRAPVALYPEPHPPQRSGLRAVQQPLVAHTSRITVSIWRLATLMFAGPCAFPHTDHL